MRPLNADIYRKALVEDEKESKFSMAYNGPTIDDTMNNIEENEESYHHYNSIEGNTMTDEAVLREKIVCIQDALPDLGDGILSLIFFK